MSEDYKNYTFTTGGSPIRTYQGQRMNPREGIELGVELAGLLAGLLKDLNKVPNPIDSGELIDISDVGGIKGITENYKLTDMISVVSSCYLSLDKKKYFSLFDYILEKTVILAKRETDKNSTILRANSKDFNDWFSEYPQDMAYFTAAVLVENAAPFLPENLQHLNLSANTLKMLFVPRSTSGISQDIT